MGLSASILLAAAIELVTQVAAGLRVALVLFAAMTLLSRPRRHVSVDFIPWLDQLDRAHALSARAWTSIAVAALCSSPFQAALLLDRPAPLVFARLGELGAVTLACAAFIQLLAARGHMIGVSPERVRRGVLTNVAVALLLVGAIWLTH